MCMKFYDDTKPLISRQMHLASAWEQHYYNLGTTQTAQKALHQTTLYFAQLHL